ncbi:unnamed protein product [Ixodes hexagonus]
MLRECCFLLRLLLSGDVETNPGPSVEELLQKVLDSQQEFGRDLKEIKQNQMRLESNVQDLDQKIDKLEKSFLEIQVLKGTVESMKDTVRILEHNVDRQNERIDELENHSRRNNLVVFGLPEEDGETITALKENVLNNIFAKTLKVTVTSLELIHRIGQKKPGTCRPVFMKFLDSSEKQDVLENCKKLKGSKLSVSCDYAKETLNIRKKLWESARSNKKKGDKVFLVHDKLRINDQMYYWNVESNTRCLVPDTKKDDRE